MDRKTSGASLLACLLAGTALTMTPSRLLAAEEGDAAPPARNIAEVETVVVTATRRAEDIQDVPLSISAMSGEMLERRGIQNFDDLSRASPGINLTNNSYRYTNTISIRGSTVASTAAAVDSGVAIYIDDLPTIGTAELRDDFFDLERVEILRGPQGTLFGRNVSGGVISVHTREPSFTPDRRVAVGYGNYDAYRAQLFVTGPVNDQVAGKLSVNLSGRDGYLTNVIRGGRQGQSDGVAGRAQLLIQPNEDLKILLGGEYVHEKGDSQSWAMLGNRQPREALAQWPLMSYEPEHTNTGPVGKGTIDNYSFLSRIDWKVAGGDLTSITGYRRVRNFDRNASLVGDPLNTALESAYERSEQISQELRFASPVDKRFRYVAGLFFLKTEREQRLDLQWDWTAFPAFAAPASARTRPAAGYFHRLTVPGSSDFSYHFVHQDTELESYAIFGEANYDILEDVTLTVGARYSIEKRSGSNQLSAAGSGLTGAPASAVFDKTFKAFTPKATLSYKATDDILLYATVAKGFKSGGFDSALLVPNNVPPRSPSDYTANPYPQETSWNYEVGAKTTFLDNRVLLNVSAFRQDYENLQQRIFVPTVAAFVPGSLRKAKVEGFELETTVRPFDWLSLGATWSHLNGKIGKNTFINNPPVNVSGNQLGLKDAVNLSAEFTWETASSGVLALGSDVTFKSKRWTNFLNNDPDFIYDRSNIEGVINGHASWTSPDERTTLKLWVRNLTNERYLVAAGNISIFYFPAAFTPPLNAANSQIWEVTWNPPRTYGVTLTREF